MPRAIPGAPYTVQSGDTLHGIARQAYGQGRRWRELWQANKTQLRSSDPNYIFPGEIINIPPDTDLVKAKADLISPLGLPTLPGKKPDDFTVMIEGVELPVEGGRVFSALDSGVRSWTASIAWTAENIEWYNRLKPYGYQKASVYLGPNLGAEGLLYNQAIKGNQEGVRKELYFFTKTADLVDSNVEPPFEQKMITLQARAQGLCAPKGIMLKFEMLNDPPFNKITANAGDKIFGHIARLASQRGGLVSATPLGELLITTPAPAGGSVGTIAEEWPPGEGLTINYDGRKRFNTYKAIAKTPGRKSRAKEKLKIALSKDPIVPTSRFMSFDASDTTAGDIQIAADWKRSKQLAESLSIPQQVSGWYDPNGNLWRENTIVTLQSVSLHVPNGYDFLIRSVEFIFSREGPKTNLLLVPPEVYTGMPLKEPWGVPATASMLKSLIREVP
jgi:hypothetical protein